MSLLGNLKKKIKVLNEEIPINETEYEGTNIKTFYHCSKISENNEEIYKTHHHRLYQFPFDCDFKFSSTKIIAWKSYRIFNWT